MRHFCKRFVAHALFWGRFVCWNEWIKFKIANETSLTIIHESIELHKITTLPKVSFVFCCWMNKKRTFYDGVVFVFLFVFVDSFECNEVKTEEMNCWHRLVRLFINLMLVNSFKAEPELIAVDIKGRKYKTRLFSKWDNFPFWFPFHSSGFSININCVVAYFAPATFCALVCTNKIMMAKAHNKNHKNNPWKKMEVGIVQ